MTIAMVVDTLGPMIVARLTFGGTHRGFHRGIALTGRRVAQVHLPRIATGRVAERWMVRDELGSLDQLGIIPPVASINR